MPEEEKKLTVEFDFDNLTIGGVILIEDWARGRVATRELITLLQKYVTNDTDLTDLPWADLEDILKQVRGWIFNRDRQGN